MYYHFYETANALKTVTEHDTAQIRGGIGGKYLPPEAPGIQKGEQLIERRGMYYHFYETANALK